MGMFSRLLHEGKELQFKHGWDDLCTYKVGDKIDWTPDPRYPGGHIDGVHDTTTDDLRRGPWVVIKDCVIVAVEPWDCERHDLEAKYHIGHPDPKLWTDEQWQAKRDREARAEAKYEAWKKEHGDDPVGYFMHLKLREPSVIDRLFPVIKEKK